MAAITHYYQSLDSATITVNSFGTDANHTVNNLYDRCKSLYWKSGNANTSGSLDIDLGVARACTSLVLGSHNYTSTSVGIKLAVGTTDDGNFANLEFVVGDAGSYHNYAAANATNWLETFNSTNKRYWRLALQAMGSATYQQLGTIFLGATFAHTINWNYGGELGSQWGVEMRETAGGIRRRQKNHDERKSWAFTFEYMNETHHTNLMTFLRAVYGNYYPFFFSDEAGSLYYVSMASNRHARPNTQYQFYNYPMVMEEEI